MQQMWIQSLGQDDPLEKGMATHSSILARTEDPGRLTVHRVAKSPIRLKQLSTRRTYTYNRILFWLLKKGNSDPCYNIDEPQGHFAL